MATNPYSYGSLGARWTVGEPTSKSLLDISRVKNDANRWVLEQLLTDPDDSTTGFGLLNGVTATTQSPSDNSTKVATTAYADAAASASATPPGGANTQIQYNNSGVFGASSNLTFDGSAFYVAGTVQSYTDSASTTPQMQIENDGAGDAALNFFRTGLQNWTMGIDGTDNSFKISGGAVLDNTTRLTIDSSGNVVLGTDTDTYWSLSNVNQFNWNCGGSVAMRISDGAFFLGETENANSSRGLTINQGATDNEILAFKSSDVAHGMTSLAETDTYGQLDKQTDAEGGTLLLGLTEGQVALELQGVVTTANFTKSTAGRAPVEARAFYKSGTSKTGQGANENTFVIYDGNGTVFIVDSDGDYFYDGGNGGAFDTYADAELARAFTHTMSDPAQVVRSRWDDEVRYNEEDLVKAKLIGYVSPEDKAKGIRPLVNGAALQRLHHGAIWQLHQQLRNQEEEIKALRGELMRIQEKN